MKSYSQKIGENVTGTLEGGQTLAFMILSLSQIVQAFRLVKHQK